MNSKDIFANLKTHSSTKKFFFGIYPFDKLPNINKVRELNKNKKEIYLVVNTDPANKPGEHWFALCIQNNLKGDVPNEYFDSYGRKPDKKIVQYLENFLIFSTQPIQNNLTTTCGQWCMCYILYKSHGGSLSQFIHFIAENINPSKRDQFVNEFINNEFTQKNIPLQDLSFIFDQQISTPKNSLKGGKE